MSKCQRPMCENETKTKYCSRSCAATVNNSKVPKRKPQGACKECGAKISTSLTYCSESCRRASRPSPTCKVCGGDGVVGRGMCREHYNSYMAKYMTERYHRRRNDFIEKRGGCCEKCGSTDQLEIDHVDPAQKGFDIGKALSGWAESRIQEELSKCQVLCSDCHKKKSVSVYAEQTSCINGHDYGTKNLGISATRGTRYCRYCQYSHNAKKNNRKVKTFEEWLKTK